MNEKISFINKLKISISNIKGYRELINEKLSKAIIYSIILSLIIGVIQGIFNFTVISTTEKAMTKVISSDEFKFTFENNRLNFENSPIKIEQGREMVYIDTNISLDNTDSIRSIVVHKDISVSILSDGISLRINGEEQNFSFNESNISEKIDNEMLLKSINILKIVKYIVFIITIISVYIKFILSALILSILGIIMNRMNTIGLKYEDIFKISIYSTTLPIIIGIIFPVGLFGFLISVIYLMLVINNLRN